VGWRIERLDRGLGAFRGSWDELNRRLYSSHPLFDSRFVEPLLLHFGTGKEHLCIDVSGGTEPRGMLLVTPGRHGQWRLFLPSQAQIAPVLIADLQSLWDLMAHLPGLCWSIDLLAQDPEYSSALSPGCNGAMSTQEHALTMNISVSGSFDEYWAQRSSRLRKNMRKYRSRADDAGLKPELVVIEDSNSMEQVVERYGGLESSGWKATGGTAVSIENEQGRFYADVLKAFAESHAAAAYELMLSGRHVASRLAIRNSEMLVILKTTYDESSAQYAPGRWLLFDLIAYEFARRRSRFIEFYTNASDDQLSWATESRMIRHVSIFRSRALLNALLVTRKVLRPFAMRSSSDPKTAALAGRN